VAAFLAQHNTGEPGRSAEDPVSTIVTLGSTQGVVAATLGEMRGMSVARDPGEPLAAISASGGHAHLILAFLQQYYGSGGMDQPIDDPLHAVTAKARHGLVEVTVERETCVLDDIGIRMLEPEEGARAHGFEPGALPDTVTIDGVARRLTKTEKYHLVGNSVPPLPIRLLAELNVRRELTVAAE
jgi:DNA (cytosine-5)-methyltransferase 1